MKVAWSKINTYDKEAQTKYTTKPKSLKGNISIRRTSDH